MLRQKQDILILLQHNLTSLEKFGVKKIGLFGSFVRNTNKPDSDIDILVEFKKGQKTYDNFYELYDYLEGLFESKIDLLTTESLSKHIGPEILKEVEYIEVAA